MTKTTPVQPKPSVTIADFRQAEPPADGVVSFAAVVSGGSPLDRAFPVHSPFHSLVPFGPFVAVSITFPIKYVIGDREWDLSVIWIL